MPRDIVNKSIIITGASSGIGAVTAVACAKAGMNCVLNARREEKLRETARKVEAAGRTAKLVVGDATNESIMTEMLDVADRELGGVYAVLANAGYGESVAMHEMEQDALRKIFDVNFFAAMQLLKRSAERLLADKQSGHLLMTSSSLAHITLPLNGAYSATKAAQHHVCRAMNMELKASGIRVSSVHPVGTTTEFFDTAAKKSAEGQKFKRPPKIFMQPPERVAKAIVRCLRKPTPEVWTSFTFRMLAGMMTVFPRTMDLVAREDS